MASLKRTNSDKRASILSDKTINKMKKSDVAFLWNSPNKIKPNEYLEKLHSKANSSLFKNKMKMCKKGVQSIAFKSKSGTNLIVPCSTNPKTNYVHLQRFIKTANQKQIDALFSKVVNIKKKTKKKFIRTEGFQVPWLHIRVENRI